MIYYVGRYAPPSGGFYTAIIAIDREGGKRMHAVLMDAGGVMVMSQPITDERFVKPLDYPVKKAARMFLKFGRQVGMGKRAKKILKEAKAYVPE